MANRTPSHPPGRNPKRVLEVRVLVAKIAWLEGMLIWNAGRIAWMTSDGPMSPAAADLARAQRSLYRIAQYPISAELALHDREAWLAKRAAQLDLAKGLRDLEAPDLLALSAPSNARNPKAIDQMTRLLIAEALCANDLPMRPSQTLLAWGESAETALRRLIEETSAPLAARALAALTLGALHHTDSGASRRSAPHLSDSLLKQAYAWGRRNALPPHPALHIDILADSEGELLSARYLHAMQRGPHLQLPSQIVREMLAKGAAPAQLVGLLEAIADAEPLAQQILRYRDSLANCIETQRRATSERLALNRQQTVSELTAFLSAYAQSSQDPNAIRHLNLFTKAMLDLIGPDNLADAIRDPLRGGLKLPANLLQPYFEILMESRNTIWDTESLEIKKTSLAQEKANSSWLAQRWQCFGRLVLNLLRDSKDPDLVREAISRNLIPLLNSQEWPDPGLFRLAMTYSQKLTSHPWYTYQILGIINCLGSGAARSVLNPLFEAFPHTSVSSQPIIHYLLVTILENLPTSRASLSATIPTIVQQLPDIRRFAERTQNAHRTSCSIGALTAVCNAKRDHPPTWFGVMLTCLMNLEQEGEGLINDDAIRPVAQLAVAMYAGDPVNFERIFRALVRRAFHQRPESEWFERGLDALKSYPTVLRPLSLIFPQQPERCAMLLTRIGLAARLGAGALTALAALTPPIQECAENASDEEPTDAWSNLLELDPALAPQAADYRHTRKLMGLSETMPPGVQRAMERPRRMAQEFAHLETLLASDPAPPKLEARAIKLRETLADSAKLSQEVNAEVRKRLEQITAEAQIDAIDKLILDCYRKRLETLTGPLPPDLPFDTNLQNATLLSVDIQSNRRLLRRLLRGHIAGDLHWRETHPANAAFLKSLAAAGIDKEAWLASHPRRYACTGAVGKRVHLHLERDPLHILQMGNYFDTCLSFGGFNSFSTVANACELNKRVLYAADSAGRIVGRKLIGINAEGKLIGFHTYTSLTDEAGNTELYGIFRRYVERFAQQCGLELAETGSIPLLFAENWYDDGVAPWSEDEAPPTKAKSSPVSGIRATMGEDEQIVQI